MFRFRWNRGSNEDCLPSASAAAHLDENLNRSSTSTKSAPERCLICEQANASFPEASPWGDSITPPSICITCVERSLNIADMEEINASVSPAAGSQASPRGNASNPLFCLCLTCYRPLPASDFPDGPIVESCQHEPNVCLDCIEKSIIATLDFDIPQFIGCPQCGDTMSADDVWRFSGVKTFQRYEKMIELAKEQECAICAETLRVSQFPKGGVTDTCTHASSTCLKCISHHIESQLETRMWDQLNCPECPALLGYADVQRHASKTTFQKYDSLTMKNVVSSDPNFRWCTAAECSSGQVHSDGAESPLIICNSCRALTCFIHQSPWHEGMTCVEFDNLENTGEMSKSPNPPKSWSLRSSIADLCDWNRGVTVGGVRRKETDQEKEDRKLAMRLVKEQEGEEKKRLHRIEQETRQQAQAEEVERQEKERRAREAQEKERRAREAREKAEREREERQRQVQEV